MHTSNSQQMLMRTWMFIIFFFIRRIIDIVNKNHKMKIVCLTVALHRVNVYCQCASMAFTLIEKDDAQKSLITSTRTKRNTTSRHNI